MVINRRIHVLLTTLTALLLIVLFTVSVCAVGETGRDKSYKLANGVWESTVYVTDSKNDNVRVHILRISKGADISLKTSTASYYKKGSTASSRKKNASKWGFATVADMMAGYDTSADTKGKTIAGINGDFYSKPDNGKTLGKLITEGKVINKSTAEPFFAVMKDGSYAMMDGSASTNNISEAIAGRMWLVRNGTVTGSTGGYETTTSIGVTADGNVVIVCVDGREPTSVGTTMYDTGDIMLKQGCTDAILLDCGGSASFVTKRSGGKATLRNVPNDGVARPVSSGLLVVRNSTASVKGDAGAAVSMKKSGTALTKKGGYYYYKANGKKISGFRTINDKQYLFNSSGKGITKTVKIGKTKYYYTKGKLTRTSDAKAGHVAIGYCGASKNKQNLLFAYHYGDKKLNVGLNPLVKINSGKMENWEAVTNVPWVAVIRRIKVVTVGDGVKNLGDFFMDIPKQTFNEEAKKIKSPLKTVTLPNSLTSIGRQALFNNTKITKLVIPKKVKTIDRRAFAYIGKATYTFRGKTPPKFGQSVFKGSGNKSVIKVPTSKKWKTLLKSKKSKNKIEYKGKVRYSL